MVDSNQDAEKMLTDMVSLFIEKNSKLNCMEDIRKIYHFLFSVHRNLNKLFHKNTSKKK